MPGAGDPTGATVPPMPGRRFPFDKLTKFYALDQINEAFEASAAGETINPIIGF